MAQVSMYNSTAAVWTGNSLILAPREPSLNPNNHYSPSAHLTENTISSKTTEFINKVSQTFFKDTKAPEVKSLNELLQFVSKNGVDPIRDKLTKKTGFFSRFFSTESWTDWLEDKTPIGRVVTLYCERLTGSTGLRALMDRLDRNTLEVANQDAALLLKSLQSQKKSPKLQDASTTTSKSFWSSFLSLPVANAQSNHDYTKTKKQKEARFEAISRSSRPSFLSHPPVAEGSSYNSKKQIPSYTIPPYTINGQYVNDQFGISFDNAGDVNGDGITDLVIGAPGFSVAPCRAYVVFGKTGLSGSLNVTYLNGADGAILIGENLCGYSVSGAGDINGDFIDDIIIGAPNNGTVSNGGGAYSQNNGVGSTYVVFGRITWISPINLSFLNGLDGSILTTPSWYFPYSCSGGLLAEGPGYYQSIEFGLSISGAGDVNADGFADIILGVPDASPNQNGNPTPPGLTCSGIGYIVFGQQTSLWPITLQLNTNTLDGTNGFMIIGTIVNEYVGSAVASAGDINGDGFGDFNISGFDYAPPNDYYTSFTIFGNNNWSSLNTLDNLNKLSGNFYIGYQGIDAGDFNNDGIPDFAYSPVHVEVGVVGSLEVFFGVQPPLPPSGSFNLLNLDGLNGFIIYGEISDDQSGWSVDAGDFNGDGIKDLLIGAPQASVGSKAHAGKTYIIFGKKNWSSSIDLSSLDGNNGVILNGENAGDSNGFSVSSAGDINDDGIVDLVIGAPNALDNAGKVYVVFGKKDWSSPIDLSSLDGNSGFILEGEQPGAKSGWSVSKAGDINGDGIGDLVVGAPEFRAEIGQLIGLAGRSYVIFGKRNWNSPIYLDSLNGENGFILLAESIYDNSGFSVSDAGDVNSDGIGDLIIGAPSAASGVIGFVGKSYILFGKKKQWNDAVDLSSLNDGADGVILGGNTNERFGYSVTNAGDMNGDGISDLAVGAPWSSAQDKALGIQHSFAGRTYIFFGKKNFGLIQDNFIFEGRAKYEHNGLSVHGAGDINGDGISDLIVGTILAGQGYVIYGNRATLQNGNTFVIDPIYAPGGIGGSLVSGGDVNNDGLSDIIIGAPFASSSKKRSGESSGSSFVIFGQPKNSGIGTE